MRSSNGFVVRGRVPTTPIPSTSNSPTALWTQQQQHRVWVDSGQDLYRPLPWSSAPWQPQVPVTSLHDRQCYACGMRGHTRRQCWQEHPELHPANRQWVDQQLALLQQGSPAAPLPAPTVSHPQGTPSPAHSPAYPPTHSARGPSMDPQRAAYLDPKASVLIEDMIPFGLECGVAEDA